MYKVSFKPNEYIDNFKYYFTEEQFVFLLNEMEKASQNLQADEYENYSIQPMIDAVSQKLNETNAKYNLRKHTLKSVENLLNDIIFDNSTRRLETKLLLSVDAIKNDMKMIQDEKNRIKNYFERIINVKKRLEILKNSFKGNEEESEESLSMRNLVNRNGTLFFKKDSNSVAIFEINEDDIEYISLKR
jgi:hypothetical protein